MIVAKNTQVIDAPMLPGNTPGSLAPNAMLASVLLASVTAKKIKTAAQTMYNIPINMSAGTIPVLSHPPRPILNDLVDAV
tara:strand:- start:118 stop:357 length:240 start_codon:yes stop_codon:yes gene_type:complete